MSTKGFGFGASALRTQWHALENVRMRARGSQDRTRALA